MGSTAALAAAASHFLATQAASRKMPPSVPQYSTSPPSFAAPSSPGHAQYFSSEPLIVSGPAGADDRRGRDMAPASFPSCSSSLPSFRVEARHGPFGSIPRPCVCTRLSGKVVDTRIEVGRQNLRVRSSWKLYIRPSCWLLLFGNCIVGATCPICYFDT